MNAPGHDERPVLVIGPNPTPNGDMHLGHIAGPYLAGDVYARYQRARGRDVVYTTGTDDSQTYVVASARRLGITPQELCDRATEQIRTTLAEAGISVDGFGPFDDAYRRTVLDFFTALHVAGRFRSRTVQLPYLERTGEFLVEGLVGGTCPTCLAESRGGLCETCGLPNNFYELIRPHSTIDPADIPIPREATILVLPLEEYREQIAEYLAAHADWRPHIVQVMREALARPLPDLPITFPLDWGIPAPFPETPGQVLNAWAETVPAGMFTAAYAGRQLGRDTEPGDLWSIEHDRRLVHFCGFDNAYLWSIPYVALLMAHGGRYVLPETIVPNEFYELENEKFSTSKGHVVWCRELLNEVPRDVARLYLALTAPEHQRTSFNRSGLEKVTQKRLVTPWNRLAGILDGAVTNAGGAALPVSPEGRSNVARMLERFDAAYELPGFSLSRAAELILVQLGRLHDRALQLDGRPVNAAPEAWGDLFLEVRALIAAAGPVLIDVAAVAGQDRPLTTAAFDQLSVLPFTPPPLGLEQGALSLRPAAKLAGARV